MNENRLSRVSQPQPPPNSGLQSDAFRPALNAPAPSAPGCER